MPWTVTRQVQWPDGTPMVEVSAGGRDYTNPDALAAKYPGEWQTFDDPVEAAEAALQVLELWHQESQPEAQVGHGSTGGMTMPFSPCTPEELRQWAEQERERLPKCDRCAAFMDDHPFTHPDLPDERFCSAHCAEMAWEEHERQTRKDMGVCDSCMDVAYDNGMPDAFSAALAMQELGLDLEDHLCDAREEPGIGITCKCACNVLRRAA